MRTAYVFSLYYFIGTLSSMSVSLLGEAPFITSLTFWWRVCIQVECIPLLPAENTMLWAQLSKFHEL